MNKLLATMSLLCFSFFAVNAEAPGNTKPNIVFLYADDFAYWAINALGNEVIQTPNLNKLVAQGVSFSNAFNMGGWNGAICIASVPCLSQAVPSGRPTRSIDNGEKVILRLTVKPGEGS